MPTDSRQTEPASEAVNLDSAESLEHAMTLAFPNIHSRAYTSTDFSYSDGSARSWMVAQRKIKTARRWLAPTQGQA